MTSSYRGTMKLGPKEREKPIEYHFSYVSTLWKEGCETECQGSEAHKHQDLRRHASHVVWTLSLHQVRHLPCLKLLGILPRGPEMSVGFCTPLVTTVVGDSDARPDLHPTGGTTFGAPHLAGSLSFKEAPAERLRSSHRWQHREG